MADGIANNKNKSAEINVTKKVTSKRHFNLKTDYILKRKQLTTFRKRNKDVYVTKKASFKGQLKSCEKLLDSGEPEIIIHGLGNAIDRATNLALQLQNNYSGTLDIDVKTSTVDFADYFEPQKTDLDDEVNLRHNSSIHIRVFRKVMIGNLKYAQ